MTHTDIEKYLEPYKDFYMRWILRNDSSEYYEVRGYTKKEFMLNSRGAIKFISIIPKTYFDLSYLIKKGNHRFEVWIDNNKVLG